MTASGFGELLRFAGFGSAARTAGRRGRPARKPRRLLAGCHSPWLELICLAIAADAQSALELAAELNAAMR